MMDNMQFQKKRIQNLKKEKFNIRYDTIREISLIRIKLKINFINCF